MTEMKRPSTQTWARLVEGPRPSEEGHSDQAPPGIFTHPSALAVAVRRGAVDGACWRVCGWGGQGGVDAIAWVYAGEGLARCGSIEKTTGSE